MKLAYVTTYDASDIHAWSGIGFYMRIALQNAGFDVEPIGSLHERFGSIFKLRQLIYSAIFSKVYLRDREPIILRSYANQVGKALLNADCKIVFSPGTVPIAYLPDEIPTVFWTDATFAGVMDFYPSTSNLCAETINDGHKMEQLALSKCRLAIYSSEWARDTALQNYDVDAGKVRVVPFGANIECKRQVRDIEASAKNKRFDICKLLFVGVDWYRKGGEIALRVTEQLNQKGVRAELDIVGCNPRLHNAPSFVKVHGFISKRTEEGRRYLDELFTTSHFFILPTRAESAAVVFAEASSFGLPSLATNIGGISTIICNGKNGQTFSLDDGPEQYSEYILKIMSSKQDYEELALSSFNEYTHRLNWISAGRKVHELLYEFCG